MRTTCNRSRDQRGLITLDPNDLLVLETFLTSSVGRYRLLDRLSRKKLNQAIAVRRARLDPPLVADRGADVLESPSNRVTRPSSPNTPHDEWGALGQRGSAGGSKPSSAITNEPARPSQLATEVHREFVKVSGNSLMLAA